MEYYVIGQFLFKVRVLLTSQLRVQKGGYFVIGYTKLVKDWEKSYESVQLIYYNIYTFFFVKMVIKLMLRGSYIMLVVWYVQKKLYV